MPNQKLSAALETLKKVTKGEGVVSMNAEEFTQYAQEQITKSTSDIDGGDERIKALTGDLDHANVLFQKNSTASVEFFPFPEQPEPGSHEDRATQLEDRIALLTIQREARVIVCHAGIGCIQDALEVKRSLLVVPRLRRFNEHMNDHQVDLAGGRDGAGEA